MAPGFSAILRQSQRVSVRFSEVAGMSLSAYVSRMYLDQKKLRLEARVGIEPTNKGFADLGLTTWLPRLMLALFAK